MRVLVVHDEFGVIHSIVQAEGIAVELSPMELHENYRFDVRRGVLVPKE